MEWNNNEVNEEKRKDDSVNGDALYDISEKALEEISLFIFSNFNNRDTPELIEFLTTDKTSPHERIFSQYVKKQLNRDEEFISDDLKELKIIMMLIVISSIYKLYLHNYIRKINADKNLKNINDIEQLREKEIVYLFNHSEDYPLFSDFISDYFVYIKQNHVFKNDCLKDIMKKNKMGILLKINPYEIFKLSEYINPKEILISERIIQDYYDIQTYAIDKVLGEDIFNQPKIEFKDEESENIRIEINNIISEMFEDNEDKIDSFYGYIFGNVYEFLKINSRERKNNCDLIEYLENPEFTLDYIIRRYYYDIDFFSKINRTFRFSNFQLEDGKLAERRVKLKKIGGVEVLKKLNTYYEEENKSFQKTLNMN